MLGAANEITAAFNAKATDSMVKKRLREKTPCKDAPMAAKAAPKRAAAAADPKRPAAAATEGRPAKVLNKSPGATAYDRAYAKAKLAALAAGEGLAAAKNKAKEAGRAAKAEVEA